MGKRIRAPASIQGENVDREKWASSELVSEIRPFLGRNDLQEIIRENDKKDQSLELLVLLVQAKRTLKSNQSNAGSKLK